MFVDWWCLVGEEDELLIKEVVELVVEGMGFEGKVEVFFVKVLIIILCILLLVIY